MGVEGIFQTKGNDLKGARSRAFTEVAGSHYCVDSSDQRGQKADFINNGIQGIDDAGTGADEAFHQVGGEGGFGKRLEGSL